MFCINCGKELKEGSVFCVHCGYKQIEQEQNGDFIKNDFIKTEEKRKEQFDPQKLLKSVSVFDFGIIGFYAITIIKWMLTFVTNFSYMWEVVRNSYSDMSFIFALLYFILFMIVVAICGGGIWFTVKKKYNVLVSLVLAAVGVILKIGSLISRIIAWDSFFYAGGVVVSIYGYVGPFLFVMGILSAVFLYAKNTSSI